MNSSGEYAVDPDAYTIEEIATKARKFFLKKSLLRFRKSPRPRCHFMSVDIRVARTIPSAG
jgi:hypothetical protein